MNEPQPQHTVSQRMRVQGHKVRSLRDSGLTWVTLDPIPDLACGADLATRRLPGLGLQSGLVWGNRHQHRQADVAAGNDDVSLHVNVSGISMVSGRGREIVLRDGDAVLLSYAEPRVVMRPRLVDHRIVRLPRASLAPLVSNIDDALLLHIPRAAGALSLLTTYIGALIEDPAIELPDIRQIIAAQLCDLIAFTVRATRGVTGIAEGGGIRVARLRAIKRDIEANLTNSELSVASTARRQGISESYIRKLFESEDTSFSKFVLSRRLVRAHRSLLNRDCVVRTIGSIAFDCGFGDLSYFNRVFKRAYGRPPSEIRDETMGR